MTKKILFITIVLSFLVRIIYSSHPPLLWDEAAIGYNAYSIIHTQRDEYGSYLPYIFKSFGDYKPGFYIYLTTPFVATFGLTPLAVRLPSIILGSLLPLLLYLLIIKLSPKSTALALYSSLLLAFNPWNIHFSRGAWEANVLVFELVLASLLFLNKKYLLSAIIFGLTLYTYQGGKMMSPLIILILMLITKTIIFSKNFILKFVLPLFIFALPIAIGLLTQNDSNRLQVFGLWSYHRPTVEIESIVKESDNLNYSLFHNEFIFLARGFTERYFNHFSLRFITFEGDWQISRHSAPYVGMMLYPSIIFLIIGFFSALLSPAPINTFFILWLLVGPLPAALTRDIIQPVRSLSLSIPLIYFTALGIFNFINWKLEIRNWKLIGNYLLFFVFSLSFTYYSELYYHHLAKVRSDHWLYGYEPAMKYALANQDGKQVTFTDFYGQPYIYYLFFSQYDPTLYQQKSNLITTGLDTGRVDSIDNFKFATPDFQALRNLPNQLMIFSYDDALRQAIDLSTLTPLSPINGHSSFYAYETK